MSLVLPLVMALFFVTFPALAAAEDEAARASTSVQTESREDELKTLSKTLASGSFDDLDLDRVWKNRHLLHGSLREFSRQSPEIPDEYPILYRTAKTLAYVGHFVQGASKSERHMAFSLGYQIAERAIELQPSRAEGHYWYAINYLGHLDMKGVLASLSGASKALGALNRSLETAEASLKAATLRARGRVFLKFPPSPISIGNREKSIEDLNQAVQLEPRSPFALMYLAQTEAELGNHENAKARHEQLKELLRSEGLPQRVGVVESARIGKFSKIFTDQLN